LDCWIRRSPENVDRVLRALGTFGAPLDNVSRADLLTPDYVIQIGVAPSRIDIVTSIDGVDFEEAWPNRLVISIDGVSVPLIGRAELIRNKRASGRPRDLADVAELESSKSE
jgi:hypothetical protein